LSPKTEQYKLRFSVVTDTHLDVGGTQKDAYKLLSKSVQILEDTLSNLKGKIDYLFLLGDLIEAKHHPLQNLEVLRQILEKSSIPTLLLMGNHDTPHKTTRDIYEKKDFTKSLSGFGFTEEDKAYWRHDVPGKAITFLGLDTSLTYTSYGAIDETQRKWLISQLEDVDKERHIILFMHHPTVVFHPFILEKKEMKMYVLKEHDSFLKILLNYPQIKAVISGHLHMPHYKNVGGIHFISCPSIVSWPNMYANFIVTKKHIEYSCKLIKRKNLTEKAYENLCRDEPSLRNFGTAETIISYYSSGPRQGSFPLS
jgi:3',5'-cyclic-AMP phosphodiesterase